MRILILLVIVAAVVLAVALLPIRPWLEQRRRESAQEPYRPEHRIDPSEPPPAVPEPEDDVGPAGRDVPPGSRRDRERHGKP